MKRLILVRHAKSDWGTEFLKDIDRPLNDRGYTDAYFMSDWFHNFKSVPDQIISSTATRALNTALIFARALNFDMNNFRLEKDLYECTAEQLLETAKTADNKSESVMLFCHNPAITNVCNDIIKDFFIDNIPTGGIVGIKFSVNSWEQITDAEGELDFYQFPKNFKNTD